MPKKNENIISESIQEKELSDEDIDGFFDAVQEYDYDENSLDEDIDLQDSFSETDELEEQPFEEEFDKKKVVNRDLQKAKKITNEGKIQKEISSPEFDELSDFSPYSDEERKNQLFQFEYGSSEPVKDDDEILRNNFKDFLVLKKLAGKSSGLSGTGLYHSDRLIDTGKKIKIYDDPEIKKESRDSSANIVIHKNDEGDIETIEITCQCGERTIINLDYASEERNDEVYTKEIPDEPVKTKPREEAVRQELKKAEDPLENREIPVPAPEPEQFFEDDIPAEKLISEKKEDMPDTKEENQAEAPADNPETDKETCEVDLEDSPKVFEMDLTGIDMQSADTSLDDDDDEPLLSLEDLQDV